MNTLRKIDVCTATRVRHPIIGSTIGNAIGYGVSSRGEPRLALDPGVLAGDDGLAGGSGTALAAPGVTHAVAGPVAGVGGGRVSGTSSSGAATAATAGEEIIVTAPRSKWYKGNVFSNAPSLQYTAFLLGAHDNPAPAEARLGHAGLNYLGTPAGQAGSLANRIIAENPLALTRRLEFLAAFLRDNAGRYGFGDAFGPTIGVIDAELASRAGHVQAANAMADAATMDVTRSVIGPLDLGLSVSSIARGNGSTGDYVTVGMAIVPGIGRGLGKAADTIVPEIGFARRQLQHGFKHAGDFGIAGNANNKNFAEFSSAIQNHVAAPTTQAIQGSYRGQAVTHFVDPQTGLNVIRDGSGNFLSGWKLSQKQLGYVLTTGKLGGGK